MVGGNEQCKRRSDLAVGPGLVRRKLPGTRQGDGAETGAAVVRPQLREGCSSTSTGVGNSL